MSYVKIMIHSVWGTKNRSSLINPSAKNKLLNHIRENAKKQGIFIDTINSQPDHVHCLFALNATMSVSTALNLIKGEASRWANKERIIKPKLEWADEYFAASVSESQLPKVRQYILNQDEHHRKVTFQQEFNNFMKGYGLNKNED